LEKSLELYDVTDNADKKEDLILLIIFNNLLLEDKTQQLNKIA
jgi:hypothetical protein